MSFSKSKLSDPYFKQLLLNIEQSNLLRKDLTFGAICCVQPNYYDANEDLEKKYGCEFDQIKRRTVSSYIKLLDRFSVPIGPALQQSLRKNEKTASSSKKIMPASSEDSSSSASSSSSSASSSDESVAKTTERFKDISIPKEIEQIFTLKEIERIEQTPPISCLKKKKIMFSPDTESATPNPIADGLNFVELLESVRQDGTAYEYPVIHIVPLANINQLKKPISPPTASSPDHLTLPSLSQSPCRTKSPFSSQNSYLSPSQSSPIDEPPDGSIHMLE
jgi:hypothetical protein